MTTQLTSMSESINTMSNKPMNQREAAQHLGISVETLRTWRRRKTGPVFYRVGVRRIIYKPTDLDSFMRKRDQ